MRTHRVFPMLLLAGAASMAHAASFDCKLARTKLETMICADSDISWLDDQLHAAYARRLASSGDGKAEKTLQLAWLKRRNSCTDAECLRRSYENRIAELNARSASPSALVGFWKKQYDCSQATGIYEQRCKEGDRDVFELAIAVKGDRVCITHMATGQLGNRVDEVEDRTPSMTGKLDAKVAMVNFHSHWGGTGQAMLRVDGDTLHWKVTAKDGGESWIPDDAVLARVPAGPYDRLPDCP